MIGTVEIFSEETGYLVFSDGFANTKRIDLERPRAFLVVRRLGPGIVPRLRRMRFALNDFLSWHLHGDKDALGSFGKTDQKFLQNGLMPYEE